jgi:hypothetical protein
VKDELAAAGGRVDRLLEAAEPDFPTLQDGDRLDQVLERAPQPVELPDDEGVALPEVVEGGPELRAVALGAGGGLLEDAPAAGGASSWRAGVWSRVETRA